MRSMSLGLLGLLFFCKIGTAGSFGAGPKIHDSSQAFLAYWKTAKNQPLDQQVRRFKAEVVPLFPEFYTYKIDKWTTEGKDPDVEIGKSLRDFPGIEKRFAQLSQEVPGQLTKYLSDFQRYFHDFKTDFDVYVVHSLGEMDGGTRTIGGHFFFVIGVDGMTKHHVSSESPFFHHEFLHVYHWQRGFETKLFYSSLWSEGLATYVSQVTNPGVSMNDIILDKALVSSCQKKMCFLWNDMESKLLSDSEADYHTYFLGSSTSKDVPRRAGYYLGYLVAKYVGQTVPLTDLPGLKDASLLARVKDAISVFKKGCP